MPLVHVVFVCALAATAVICADEPETQPYFGVPSIHQITPPYEHSEGPTWDHRKQMLYFVDIHSGRVLSYNYKTKGINSITLNGKVTPVIVAKSSDNVFVVGVNRSLVAVEWDGAKELGGQKVLSTVSHQFPSSRFNDGKADKNGRLWVGTMGPEDHSGKLRGVNQGALYKFSRSHMANPVVMLAPVNISNGLVWNAANDKMYYIDSPTKKVVEFDYNDEAGTIRFNRSVFNLNDHPHLSGNPDGMTIDADGYLWVALYGGGSVIKVNPKDGAVMQIIALPATDVTSAVWGGPTFDVLFVTTSRRTLSKEQERAQPGAGSVFAITGVGSRGLPQHFCDVVDGPIRKNLLAQLISSTTGLLPPPISNEILPVNSNTLQKRTQSEQPENQFWRTMMNAIRNLF